VYADTSVFGGVFDDEFKETSKTFVEAIIAGTFFLVTSEVVRQEIATSTHRWRSLHMKTKAFDCVRMKRQGGEQVLKHLEGKTAQEQLEYGQKGTEELKKHQQTLEEEVRPECPIRKSDPNLGGGVG